MIVGVEPDELGEILGIAVRTVRPLGSGLDNRAYEVNGGIVVRVADEPDADATRHETTVLRAVHDAIASAGLGDVAVPDPVVVRPEAGLIAYPKLPGTPLAFLPQPRRVADDAVATLTRLMTAIREVSTTRVDVAPADEWLAEAAEAYAAVCDHVPAAYRPAVETFLSRPGPPPNPLSFCHNDLGTEHVLVDAETRRVTGVIDWTDAAMADPAYDLGRLYRDLGPPVRPTGAARFYARCALLEDLRFGVEENRVTYRDNALAALAWTYGDMVVESSCH